MIFTKEFVVDKFVEKINNNLIQVFPFENSDKTGEISSGRNMIMSFFQHFDLKSEEVKDLMAKARKEINEVCLKEENLGIYPNTEKVNNCIKSIETKHLGKVYDNRNLYFGNGKKYYYVNYFNF